MSAARSSRAHPLRDDPSPATVRAWLLPDDQDRLITDHEAALDDARSTLDLAVVHDVVEHWRRIAILQTDPEGFRETVRRAAELATGDPVPEDEPFDQSRRKADVWARPTCTRSSRESDARAVTIVQVTIF